MCDICRQAPCHPRCPNAPELISVYVCSGCGHDIYEGEDVYDIFGEQFCERCIEESARFAEEALTCCINDDVICEDEEYYEIMGRIVCKVCVNEARREAIFIYDEDYRFDL